MADGMAPEQGGGSPADVIPATLQGLDQIGQVITAGEGVPDEIKQRYAQAVAEIQGIFQELSGGGGQPQGAQPVQEAQGGVPAGPQGVV
jgi:hypothetical protein